jgi:hypothetical protein
MSDANSESEAASERLSADIVRISIVTACRRSHCAVIPRGGSLGLGARWLG